MNWFSVFMLTQSLAKLCPKPLTGCPFKYFALLIFVCRDAMEFFKINATDLALWHLWSKTYTQNGTFFCFIACPFVEILFILIKQTIAIDEWTAHWLRYSITLFARLYRYCNKYINLTKKYGALHIIFMSLFFLACIENKLCAILTGATFPLAHGLCAWSNEMWMNFSECKIEWINKSTKGYTHAIWMDKKIGQAEIVMWLRDTRESERETDLWMIHNKSDEQKIVFFFGDKEHKYIWQSERTYETGERHQFFGRIFHWNLNERLRDAPI